MKDYLIVDGYNIIGSWPDLYKLAETQLEDARDRLIQLLAEYQGYMGLHVILVFDAHQVPGLGAKYKQNGVDIRYTKAKETADECIERLVTELANRRRNLYVATSDNVEQHVTFGKGALRISARELLLDVNESQVNISKQIQEQSYKLKKRNTFDSKLTGDLRDQFEKMRRDK